MTFLIARIDAALAAAVTGIGNKLCNALDAALAAAVTGIGNKLCNALDASLYHDWDLEDTPNDGADLLADDDLGPLACCGGIVGHTWRCPKHAQRRGQIDGADQLPEREAEEEVASTHPRPTPANQRQLTGRRHDHHEHHQQCVLQLGSTDECETGVGPNRCWRARL